MTDDRKCIDCQHKHDNPCKPCYENETKLGWHYYWKPITEEAMPYANGLIKEFLEDLKKSIWYDGQIGNKKVQRISEYKIFDIIKKWEKRLL